MKRITAKNTFYETIKQKIYFLSLCKTRYQARYQLVSEVKY